MVLRSIFLATGVGSTLVAVCFLHAHGQKNMEQTAGRPLPRINGRVINTIATRGWTRGWVGARNKRPPVQNSWLKSLVLSIYVEDSQSRRFDYTFCCVSDRSWPNISPGVFSYGFLRMFETSIFKICPHSEWYRSS